MSLGGLGGDELQGGTVGLCSAEDHVEAAIEAAIRSGSPDRHLDLEAIETRDLNHFLLHEQGSDGGIDVWQRGGAGQCLRGSGKTMDGLGCSIEERIATTGHRVEAGVEVDVVETVGRASGDGDAESALGLEVREVRPIEDEVALGAVGDASEESGKPLGDQVVAEHATGSRRDRRVVDSGAEIARGKRGHGDIHDRIAEGSEVGLEYLLQLESLIELCAGQAELSRDVVHGNGCGGHGITLALEGGGVRDGGGGVTDDGDLQLAESGGSHDIRAEVGVESLQRRELRLEDGDGRGGRCIDNQGARIAVSHSVGGGLGLFQLCGDGSFDLASVGLKKGKAFSSGGHGLVLFDDALLRGFLADLWDLNGRRESHHGKNAAV